MHQNLVQTIQFDPVKGGGGQNSCKATEFATIQSAAGVKYIFRYKVQRNLRKMRHPSFLQHQSGLQMFPLTAENFL